MLANFSVEGGLALIRPLIPPWKLFRAETVSPACAHFLLQAGTVLLAVFTLKASPFVLCHPGFLTAGMWLSLCAFWLSAQPAVEAGNLHQ